jgi:deoxyguanosine kinase
VLVKRLRAREKDPERPFLVPEEDYIRELNEAYHHFFFHYSATSLLVIESSQFRPQDDDEALDALVKQIKTMGRGTRYYVPRTG